MYVANGSAVIVRLERISEIGERFKYDWHKSLFIYWCLDLTNISSQITENGHYVISSFTRKKLGRMLASLADNDVVKFMGRGAYVKVLGPLGQPYKQVEWLPNMIPFNDNDPEPSYKRLKGERIRFSWLGRLDYAYAKILTTYMNELEQINKEHPLTLSIVGLGDQELVLKQRASSYSYPIEFVGEKRGESLAEFIRNETDIGLASGTSIYEFALRGKPVIVKWRIPKIYEAGELHDFTLTHEGNMVEYTDKFETNFLCGNTFKAKVDQLLNDYEESAKMGYQFVLTKSPKYCCKQLLNAIVHISDSDPQEITNMRDSIEDILIKGKQRISALRKFKNRVKSVLCCNSKRL